MKICPKHHQVYVNGACPLCEQQSAPPVDWRAECERLNGRVKALEDAGYELVRRNVIGIYDYEGRSMYPPFIAVVTKSFDEFRALLPRASDK